MESIALFPFHEYWWFYLAFTGFVLGMLLLDLGVFHKHAHEVSFREAAGWSVAWISLAAIFNYLLYRYALWKLPQDPRIIEAGIDVASAARQVGLEFLTGFVVEKTLAIDNIFVFVMIFSYFAIPKIFQHRILFYGIIGALIFRAIFIALGSVLMRYHWVLWVFGGFLIFTGIKMIFSPEQKIEPEKNPVLRLIKKVLPVTTKLHGQKLLIRQGGKWVATPLMVTLLIVEMSDIIFAIDSVPAIFALTKEPLIVFSSNIFAILGLRSMYFMLAGIVDKFHMLKYGLALVLIFVGLKMVWLNDLFGGKFPITWSLGIIAGLIITFIVLSLLIPPRHSDKHEEVRGSV